MQKIFLIIIHVIINTYNTIQHKYRLFFINSQLKKDKLNKYILIFICNIFDSFDND